MLETIEIKKSFGTIDVLKGISLTIDNGKITSIVGKNGAGKSTIISLMVGYKKLTGGNIKKENLSVMPDADNLFPEMTGLYFLKFIAKLKNQKITSEEIKNLAESLRIHKDLNKKIENYSFGMKKKLAFIQAYIGEFDTYIFDEPTSGVDVESAAMMMKLLEKLKEKNAAILLTSHNLEEIERHSDYVYLLDDGVISKHGTIASLKENKERILPYLVYPESYDDHFMTVAKMYAQEFSTTQLTFNEQGAIVFTEDINAFILYLLQKDVRLKGFFQEELSLRDIAFA